MEEDKVKNAKLEELTQFKTQQTKWNIKKIKFFSFNLNQNLFLLYYARLSYNYGAIIIIKLTVI